MMGKKPKGMMGMIPSLRQERIVDLLQRSKKVYFLGDLAEQLGASESTLRRDLKVLEKNGQISVLRGGGVCIKHDNVELDIESKLHVCLEEKKPIARYAASLVKAGDIVFMDPSSICCLMIDYLDGKQITVVTNSCANMSRLLKKNIRCIMIGGEAKKGTYACIGSMAEEMLQKLGFTKCFLGANGLTEQFGITNHDPDECSIKQLAMRHSKEVYFLINSSKSGVTNLCQVARIDAYPIVMDSVPDAFAKYPNIRAVPEEDAKN